MLIEKSQILLPNSDVDLYKFCVVAVDQFTSDPEYWGKAEQLAQGVPSALHLVLPELYLGMHKEQQRQQQLPQISYEYLQSVLTNCINGFIYTKRILNNDTIRYGLVAALDLEEYDFAAGSTPAIRPTERTVAERIPPRCTARQNSLIESPHILMLLCNPECDIIEPLDNCKGRQVYNTPLQQGGGHIEGWAIEDEDVISSLKSRITDLYVGDGNHSLAAAKMLYEKIKAEKGSAAKTHPARYCLAEIINLYSPALQILPIHRAIFGISKQQFYRAAEEFFVGTGASFTAVSDDNEDEIYYDNSIFPLAVLAADGLFEYIAKRHSGSTIDYIHGDDELLHLTKNGAVGMRMPIPEKERLIPYILKEGVFPKKYFSLGHGADKRYYLECRKIV